MTDFMKSANGEPAIKLGKTYRDTIHSFEGVATIVSRHLTGCDRVCLETLEKGDLKETWFDITRLEEVNIAESDHKPGGPKSTPPARTTG